VDARREAAGARSLSDSKEQPSTGGLPIVGGRSIERTQDGLTVADDPGIRIGKGPPEATILLIAHPENQHLGARYRLVPGERLEIGRAPDAAISLSDVPSLSRRHARLWFHDGVVHLEDLGSRNGSWVNDRRVRGSQALGSGDRFQLGAVHFKLLHERDVEHAYHLAIHEMLERDGLTGAFNRRKFTDEAAREVSRARRHRRPLALLLLDLDRFKLVNDRLGHLAGDAVLKQLVDRCLRVVRTEELLARLGGEEFAILCPEMAREGAIELAEKVRALCASEPFDAGGTPQRVTISCGVATFDGSMRTVDDLVDAADRALYEAKRSGRDRVVAAPPEDDPTPG